MVTRNITHGARFVSMLLGCGVLVAVFSAVPTRAWNENRVTRMTFNSPVALPGVTLSPGTYVFSLPEEDTNRTLVLVRENVSPYHVRYLGVTVPVARTAGLPKEQQLTFGLPDESQIARGEPSAPTVVAWYPLDDHGYKFLYAGRDQ